MSKFKLPSHVGVIEFVLKQTKKLMSTYGLLSKLKRLLDPETLKAGTDYGTCSAAQPDAAAKNMMFTSVDSQQTCCEHAMNIVTPGPF